MKLLSERNAKRGDTIIEVTLSIAIFALVSVITIQLMNSGLSTSQSSLEITMARNEIDAQAEALRFIHSSYISERNLVDSAQGYTQLWDKLTIASGGYLITADKLPALTSDSCATQYSKIETTANKKAFVLNTRLLRPSNMSQTDLDAFLSGESTPNYANFMNDIVIPYTSNKLKQTPLYPRLIFTRFGTSATGNSDAELNERNEYLRVSGAEGIWVLSVKSGDNYDSSGQPQFYDFHIYTCWYAPGRSNPSTIGTIIRLYNPNIYNV